MNNVFQEPATWLVAVTCLVIGAFFTMLFTRTKQSVKEKLQADLDSACVDKQTAINQRKVAENKLEEFLNQSEAAELESEAAARQAIDNVEHLEAELKDAMQKVEPLETELASAHEANHLLATELDQVKADVKRAADPKTIAKAAKYDVMREQATPNQFNALAKKVNKNTDITIGLKK